MRLGKSLGEELEAGFSQKANQAGLSDEEAKSAFNNNMMATGLLSESPAEFAKQANRKWLVSAYEAGDVVLHGPFAVRCPNLSTQTCKSRILVSYSCFNYQIRP